MPHIGYVLLVIAALGVGIWLATHLEGMRERSKKSKVAFEHPFPKYSEPVTTTTPLEVPATVARKDNGQDLLKDRLRERKAANQDLATSLASAMTEFGNRATMNDALTAALQVGYSANDVGAFMAQRQYHPREIATILVEYGDVTIKELGNIIMPVAKGETLVARAAATFEIVRDVFDVQDDDEYLCRLPSDLGCSAEEAATILYRDTSLTLAFAIKFLKLANSPETVAKLAKDLAVELSDEEEYEALRDEDDEVEFDAAAKILKACGESAESIIAAEDRHDEFSSDELGDIFSSLSTAGFTNPEIMSGISDADIVDENQQAAIVQAALESKVSIDDVVKFLKDEGVDPDELDEEMRMLEFAILTRIDVLHAFLHLTEKN